MKKPLRAVALSGAAALLVGLWGCTLEAPVPAQIMEPAPTAAAELTILPGPVEPPLLDWMENQPVPDFLDEDQQQLFLRAYSAAAFLMGCGTGVIEEYPLPDGSLPDRSGPDWAQYVEYDGWSYLISVGRFRQWDDFQAMLDGLFTPEYQEELLHSEMGDGESLPLFRATEDGLLCYLDTGRGSDLEYGWCDTPDSYELVSRTEDEIVFHLIGHYAVLDYDGETDMPVPVDEYNIAYPIRMERTENGWRVAEFHLPY